VFGRVDEGGWLGRLYLPGEGVDLQQPVDLIAPKLDADGVPAVHRKDLDGVAAHPKRALLEVHVVALVVQIDQPSEQFVAVDPLVGRQFEGQLPIVARITQPVDRRDAGDDDHVVPRQQRPRCGVPQPLDLLVDRHILVDVGVGLLDVGLRLVVVVVGNKVFDGVVGKQLPKLLVELGRQRLVVGDDERRLVDLLDNPRDGVCFARAGDAEQCLLGHPGFVAGDQLLDRVGLIAGRLERCVDGKGVIFPRPIRLEGR
jgi:hypothetical protein